MSREKLKVAIIAHDIAWGDKDENIITVAELLNRVDKDTDVVVLPELFCTGFVSDLEQLHEMAEDEDGVTVVNLYRWSQYFKFAICGSFLAKENGRYYNRAFFVEPSGEITYYDKKHLFRLSNESKCFEPGKAQSSIVRFRGWNISMLACYDVRFPVWCRNVDSKIDVVLVPANWPKVRGYAWRHLLIARAIENQYYIVGANRSGKDDYGDYNETSYIFDYKGTEIEVQSSKSTQIYYGHLDKIAMEKYRTGFPVIKDSDRFELLQ